MSSARTVLLCSALSLLLGCAGRRAFESSFPRGDEQLATLLREARARESATPQAIVLGVGDAPRSVFAYDLAARRMLFREPDQATSEPELAGELVVVPLRDRLLVRELRSGRVLHEFASRGMELVGAAGNRELAAITLTRGGAITPRSRLLVLRDGKLSADLTAERTFGVPAVLGGLLFVPHQRVHVSVLDARGTELGRVTIRDDVASYAFRQGKDVYFGQRGVYLLDETTARGPSQGAHYYRPTRARKLPGRPAFLPDTSSPRPPLESALHRVFLRFAPTRDETEEGGVGLLHDALYVVFYRQLFALDEQGRRPRWVRECDSDVVGASAFEGGLATVEASGRIQLYDPLGRRGTSLELGLRPLLARLYIDGLAAAASEEQVEPVAIQLESAVNNPDTRLVPSRAFAAALLAEVDEDEAARVAIALCADDALPTRIRNEACEAVAMREQPSAAVLAALTRHADFLEAVGPPPLTPLARAIVRSRDARASAPLIAQLNDPATPSEALPELLRALAATGDGSAAPAVASFVRLYHADASDDEFERTLAVAMDTLLALDRELARGVLEPIASAAFARPGVRASAREKLRALGPASEPSEPEQAEASAESEPTDDANEREASEPATSEPEAGARDEPPVHLTTGHLDRALAPVRPQLAACVAAAPERPASARLLLVISGEGSVLELRTLPTSVAACVEPLVRPLSFPSTRYGQRSVMSYFVSR